MFSEGCVTVVLSVGECVCFKCVWVGVDVIVWCLCVYECLCVIFFIHLSSCTSFSSSFFLFLPIVRLYSLFIIPCLLFLIVFLIYFLLFLLFSLVLHCLSSSSSSLSFSPLPHFTDSLLIFDPPLDVCT